MGHYHKQAEESIVVSNFSSFVEPFLFHLIKYVKSCYLGLIAAPGICPFPRSRFRYRKKKCKIMVLSTKPRFHHLLAATETQHQVESRLLLDVVVAQGPSILELLAGEDETLLIRGNALLILDLALDIVDGIR